MDCKGIPITWKIAITKKQCHFIAMGHAMRSPIFAEYCKLILQAYYSFLNYNILKVMC